jgi:hypothetical protein
MMGQSWPVNRPSRRENAFHAEPANRCEAQPPAEKNTRHGLGTAEKPDGLSR